MDHRIMLLSNAFTKFVYKAIASCLFFLKTQAGGRNFCTVY